MHGAAIVTFTARYALKDRPYCAVTYRQVIGASCIRPQHCRKNSRNKKNSSWSVEVLK